VRIRYVKVAEYQHRGAVHFHTVIRLDANDTHDPDGEYRPPPARYTAETLARAIRQAAADVALLAGDGDGTRLLRFGRQTDTRPIHRADVTATGQPLDVAAVANYIAKYATKTLDAPGLPGRPLRSSLDLGQLRCHRHYRQLIAACWRLGGRDGDPRLRRWAHMLGYGGHYLTKSRRYSVTFGQLRTARTQHRRATRHPDGELDPWGRPLDETVVLVLRDIVKPNLAPKTYETREMIARLYIIPFLGGKRIDKLTARDVRQWLNQLRDGCQCCIQGKDARRPQSKQRCCALGRCCHQAISARTLRDARDVLRAALGHAVSEDELITRNVASLVCLPCAWLP
jgi:Phage integrase, N-terminal SAM-like domain